MTSQLTQALSAAAIAPASVNDGFSTALGFLPGPLITILGAIGAVMAVGSIVIWLVKRGGSGGSGMKGFPWMMVIGGSILAMITIGGGFLATLGTTLIRIIVAFGELLLGMFG